MFGSFKKHISVSSVNDQSAPFIIFRQDIRDGGIPGSAIRVHGNKKDGII